MTQLPVRRELQVLGKPAGRRGDSAKSVWDQVITTITNPELVVIAIFCTIGLLVAVNVILRFPDFGGMAAQLQQFP